MLLAVPSMVLMAASRLPAVISGILSFAISSTFFLVTFPTLSLFGSFEPFSTLAALRRGTEAGGVLVTKEKDLSAYTVMTTGMIMPSCACVLALKVLQTSIILTPCCPSAGPTGGDGLAFPAGICS